MNLELKLLALLSTVLLISDSGICFLTMEKTSKLTYSSIAFSVGIMLSVVFSYYYNHKSKYLLSVMIGIFALSITFTHFQNEYNELTKVKNLIPYEICDKSKNWSHCVDSKIIEEYRKKNEIITKSNESIVEFNKQLAIDKNSVLPNSFKGNLFSSIIASILIPLMASIVISKFIELLNKSKIEKTIKEENIKAISDELIEVCRILKLCEESKHLITIPEIAEFFKSHKIEINERRVRTLQGKYNLQIHSGNSIKNLKKDLESESKQQYLLPINKELVSNESVKVFTDFEMSVKVQ